MQDLIKLIKIKVESMPSSKAHTYSSENSDVYRAYDKGYEDAKKYILAFLEVLEIANKKKDTKYLSEMLADKIENKDKLDTKNITFKKK